MKKILLFILSICLLTTTAECSVYNGNVSKEGSIDGTHRIVDADTNQPIGGAEINIPQKKFSTKTNQNGMFNLKADISGDTIMSVKKDGYKPFSLTINEQIASRPITVGIEKSSPRDIQIESSLLHLGDNSYSELSANAGEFKVQSAGPSYTKQFLIKSANGNSNLVIGSIIGIDTKIARSMGQNKIVYAYSSPPEVFFNGTKIAEIQLNGDGQRIKIPNNLIKLNKLNEVTIKTGRNMAQTSYIDYDDIEFINLYIESN